MIKTDRAKVLEPEWSNDYDLAQEASKGNADAWNKLYNKAYPVVFGYARRYCAAGGLGHIEPEDITMESFEKCYYRLAAFEGRSKFSTWVCAFCRYTFLQKLYQFNERRSRIPDREVVWNSLYMNSTPERIVSANERSRCISAFDSLSPNHRLLLECYVLKEKTPSQVIRMTKLRGPARKAELELAIRTMRNRYMALYVRGGKNTEEFRR